MGEPNQIRDLTTQYDRPSFYMQNASQAFFLSMAGRGNRSDIQLRNCLRELVTAHEKGQPIDELSPTWETQRLPAEDDLREVWLILSAAIENEAVLRCQQREREAAQNEAITSMTLVTA